eukprot:3612207-Rhodomonas_salina.2
MFVLPLTAFLVIRGFQDPARTVCGHTAPAISAQAAARETEECVSYIQNTQQMSPLRSVSTRCGR